MELFLFLIAGFAVAAVAYASINALFRKIGSNGLPFRTSRRPVEDPLAVSFRLRHMGGHSMTSGGDVGGDSGAGGGT